MPKGKAAKVEEADFKTPYVEAICKFADLDKIAKANFKFAIDCMYGAGRNVLAEIFQKRGIQHVQIRSEVNPLFPGINPEPIEPHVRAAQEIVVKEKCHAAFITDGDADRIGAAAEDGSFVDSHKIFSILLQWVVTRHQDWPGDVARAFNTTRMLDRIAAKHGNDDFSIPLSRLSDIETKGIVPSIYRLYSLAVTYRCDLRDILSWYGIDVNNAASDLNVIEPRKSHRVDVLQSATAVRVPLRGACLCTAGG